MSCSQRALLLAPVGGLERAKWICRSFAFQAGKKEQLKPAYHDGLVGSFGLRRSQVLAADE